MPSVRSLLLHLAIAAAAIVVVTIAAVAIGLSGSHAFGAKVEPTEPVRLAVSDWTRDVVASVTASGAPAKLD